jgi:hypothetical protein
MPMLKRVLPMAASGLLLAVALAPQAAQAEVTFVPGTYELANFNLGPVVDTLVVTVSGGVADFTATGEINATFSVPEDISPTGGTASYYFYYDIPATPVTASWDTTSYPYLSFWSSTYEGGVTAGAIPGDDGPNYFDLFQSTPGTAQLFAGAPEPATWALLVLGLLGLGATLRASRRRLSFVPAA